MARILIVHTAEGEALAMRTADAFTSQFPSADVHLAMPDDLQITAQLERADWLIPIHPAAQSPSRWSKMLRELIDRLMHMLGNRAPSMTAPDAGGLKQLTDSIGVKQQIVRTEADIPLVLAAYKATIKGSRPPETTPSKEAEANGGEADEEAEEDRFRGIPSDLLPPLEPPKGPPSPITRPGVIQPEPAETVDAKPQSAADPLEFSAYYPKELAPMVWQPLRAYVYRLSVKAAVSADAASQFKDFDPSAIREANEPARADIPEGALITATPQLEGFQFNPPSVSVALFENWHRFDFKLRAQSAPTEAAVNGMIVFTVDGVIVADLPISVYVSAAVGTSASFKPADQPPVTAKVYQSIFCSYSRKDTPIVERVERVHKLLGINFLRDVTTLRSGEEWNPGLLRMIDEADIFQLFWSHWSSKSQFVEQEWRYALDRVKNQNLKSFIRPVFWENPMPNVPPELGHLHFHKDETLDDGLDLPKPPTG